MILFHGDNHIHSRQALLDWIETKSSQYSQVKYVVAADLNQATLEELLGAVSLFHDETLMVIEQLHSLPRSSKKNQLISQVVKVQDRDSLVLWESKLLTPKQLKQFASATVRTYKVSKQIFRWLDSFRPTVKKQALLALLSEAVLQEGEEFCFLMLIRQVRLLLTTIGGGAVSGPVFVQNKIAGQAKEFSSEQLIKLHERLLAIDLHRKIGQSQLDLKAELDLLCIEL